MAFEYEDAKALRCYYSVSHALDQPFEELDIATKLDVYRKVLYVYDSSWLVASDAGLVPATVWKQIHKWINLMGVGHLAPKREHLLGKKAPRLIKEMMKVIDNKYKPNQVRSKTGLLEKKLLKQPNISNKLSTETAENQEAVKEVVEDKENDPPTASSHKEEEEAPYRKLSLNKTFIVDPQSSFLLSRTKVKKLQKEKSPVTTQNEHDRGVSPNLIPTGRQLPRTPPEQGASRVDDTFSSSSSDSSAKLSGTFPRSRDVQHSNVLNSFELLPVAVHYAPEESIEVNQKSGNPNKNVIPRGREIPRTPGPGDQVFFEDENSETQLSSPVSVEQVSEELDVASEESLPSVFSDVIAETRMTVDAESSPLTVPSTETDVSEVEEENNAVAELPVETRHPEKLNLVVDDDTGFEWTVNEYVTTRRKRNNVGTQKNTEAKRGKGRFKKKEESSASDETTSTEPPKVSRGRKAKDKKGVKDTENKVKKGREIILSESSEADVNPEENDLQPEETEKTCPEEENTIVMKGAKRKTRRGKKDELSGEEIIKETKPRGKGRNRKVQSSTHHKTDVPSSNDPPEVQRPKTASDNVDTSSEFASSTNDARSYGLRARKTVNYKEESPVLQKTDQKKTTKGKSGRSTKTKTTPEAEDAQNVCM